MAVHSSSDANTLSFAIQLHQPGPTEMKNQRVEGRMCCLALTRRVIIEVQRGDAAALAACFGVRESMSQRACIHLIIAKDSIPLLSTSDAPRKQSQRWWIEEDGDLQRITVQSTKVHSTLCLVVGYFRGWRLLGKPRLMHRALTPFPIPYKALYWHL